MDEADLVVVEVDAVREQRALVERAGAVEAVGDAVAAAGDRVALVGPVLGGVDVEADADSAPAASQQAASVSSESVKEAWAPTIPRASGSCSRRTRSRKRRFSATPARARSGPSRSEVS